MHESYKNFFIFFVIQTFLSLNTPEASPHFNGRMYETTALGAALSLSVLPRAENGPYQFFSNPANQTKKEVDMVENSVWRVRKYLVTLDIYIAFLVMA